MTKLVLLALLTLFVTLSAKSNDDRAELGPFHGRLWMSSVFQKPAGSESAAHGSSLETIR